MKLDERAAAKGNSHARFKRQEGSVVEKIAPMSCKPWMLKKESVAERTSTESESLTAPVAGDDADSISEAELSSDTDND